MKRKKLTEAAKQAKLLEHQVIDAIDEMITQANISKVCLGELREYSQKAALRVQKKTVRLLFRAMTCPF